MIRHYRLRTFTLWTGTTLSLLIVTAFVASAWLRPDPPRLALRAEVPARPLLPLRLQSDGADGGQVPRVRPAV